MNFLKKSFAGFMMLSLNLSVGGFGAILLTSDVAYAATTASLSATAVGNYNDWTGSPTNTNSGKVSAVSTNDGDTSYIVTGGNNKVETFAVSGAGIPSGATINSVTLFAVARGTNANSSFALRVEKGTGSGNQSDGSTITPGENYSTFSRIMTTNPFTNAAWTLAEVNAWTTKFGVIRTDANHFIRVTQLWVVVDYTVAPTTGGLVITKNTVGGDDTFNFTGSAGSFTITTVAGTGNRSMSGLAAGTYTVTETVPTGWTKTSDTCPSVVVSAGATSTCTVTNTKHGSITVFKNVVAPDGVTDVSDTHTFHTTLNGGDQKDISEGSSAQYRDLTPGTYTIAEITGDPDFDLLRISNDNDEDASNGASVIVTAGQNTEVTITNAQKQGRLTVVKHVSNHDIGNAVASDFTMSVTGSNVSPQSSFAGNEDGTIVTLDPGAYSVGESAADGYAMSQTGDCSGAMSSNGSATCTVTNSDIPTGQGAITVIKKVTNDNGGDLAASAFTLKITKNIEDAVVSAIDGSVTSGTAYFLAPDTYTVSETDPTPLGYAQKSIICTDGKQTTSGLITLSEQQAWVCTITNDDIAPSLTLVKHVVNENGGTAVASDWTLNAIKGDTTALTGQGSVSSDDTFQAGSYTLSESEGPSGYTPSSWSCVGIENDGNQITLGLGQSAVCTITNTDQPKDDVVPVTPPSSGGGGSSTFDYYGCTDLSATNFNSLANKDDGSCKHKEDNKGSDGNGGNGENTNGTVGEVLGAATTTPELALPPLCAANPYLHDYLKMGKKNDSEQVKLLQTLLNEQMDAHLPVTGFFGSLTKKWVKAFQKKHHAEIIKPWIDAGYKGNIGDGTGYVYKTTKRAINMIKCTEAAIPMPDLTPDLGQ